MVTKRVFEEWICIYTSVHLNILSEDERKGTDSGTDSWLILDLDCDLPCALCQH